MKNTARNNDGVSRKKSERNKLEPAVVCHTGPVCMCVLVFWEQGDFPNIYRKDYIHDMFSIFSPPISMFRLMFGAGDFSCTPRKACTGSKNIAKEFNSTVDSVQFEIRYFFPPRIVTFSMIFEWTFHIRIISSNFSRIEQ